MIGLSRHTLAPLSDGDHLSQSIDDILSTATGTRVMRREYGSDLPRLIGRPMNGETMVDIFAATAEALDRWEPRLRLIRVEVTGATAGQLDILLTAETISGDLVLPVSVGMPA